MVYEAQNSEPLPGDFFQLVSQDYQLLGETMNEEYIEHQSKDAFKKEIKNKTKEAALKYLKDLQSKHSKIKTIPYSSLETQPYMTSPIFNNEEVNTLHALRSRYVNVKAKYQNNMLCPLCLLNTYWNVLYLKESFKHKKQTCTEMYMKTFLLAQGNKKE